MKKKTRGHWYYFEFLMDNRMRDSPYAEVRMYAQSAREGMFSIKQDFPYAWIFYYERLDVSPKKTYIGEPIINVHVDSGLE